MNLNQIIMKRIVKGVTCSMHVNNLIPTIELQLTKTKTFICNKTVKLKSAWCSITLLKDLINK